MHTLNCNRLERDFKLSEIYFFLILDQNGNRFHDVFHIFIQTLEISFRMTVTKFKEIVILYMVSCKVTCLTVHLRVKYVQLKACV